MGSTTVRATMGSTRRGWRPGPPAAGAVMTALRAAVRGVAAGVPAAQLARLGLPALAGTLTIGVLVLGTAWWVLPSDARTGRAARLLGAWRGTSPPGGGGPVTGPGRLTENDTAACRLFCGVITA